MLTGAALPKQTENDPNRSADAAIKRKRHDRVAAVAWDGHDLRTAFRLALLLLPAWLLPESSWAPLWLCRMRLSERFKRHGIERTARAVRAALGLDVATSEDIARRLKAAIHELQMQDLRGWRPGGWKPRISLQGEEHLERALADGKGAVLWVAPFVFNSGPTKMILHEKGYRCSHLSSPTHGYSETSLGVAYLNRVRCIPEDRYLAQRIVFDRDAPSTAMRRMVRALAQGEVVSIVAASTEGTDMVQGPIFGGTLPVAVGAPRVSGFTGAPVLPVFTVRDPKLGFRVVIESPIEIAPEASPLDRCIAATAEFLTRSEAWVRRYPEQWRAWSKWNAN